MAGCDGRQTYKDTINDIFEVANRYVEDYNIHLEVQSNTTMGYYLSTDVDLQAGGELPLNFINVVSKNKALAFTTLELVKKDAKINDSLTEVYPMSDKIISDYSGNIRQDIGVLYKASEAVTMLDMLLPFAHLCLANEYICPEFTRTLVINKGRHQVIEKFYSAPFISNNTYAGSASTFQIITGPNMSGKSTYLRQLSSRIFNDDSIELNASALMMEIQETAYILQVIIEKRLVIIDDLGRGMHASASGYMRRINLYLETETVRDHGDALVIN
ncbi:MutS protein msh4 [Dissophora globulifera]|uniref:MutS protein msh4 n=1 Tax=Dissophora globulifera TaxID=979702 RepID=A0A9P6RAP7_9FUNG|nr:MutS protein msh4 [Dissophora globulifera]